MCFVSGNRFSTSRRAWMNPASIGSTSNPASASRTAGANTSARGSLPNRPWAASTPAMKPGTRALRPLGLSAGMVRGSVSSRGVL
jgi:hypothetical protein